MVKFRIKAQDLNGFIENINREMQRTNSFYNVSIKNSKIKDFVIVTIG
jgi:hypothetical protein